MEANILNFIKTHNLIPFGSKIVVGLSGGPDSVCLLHILWKYKEELGIDIVAAHLDHQARETSIRDLTFCKDLCNTFNIKFLNRKISSLDLNKSNGSKEEYWRNARRTFFQKVAFEENANLIALGHHLQDQQETFLIRLIRGTTLSGLIGIKPQNANYIRPLLETSKVDILKYLEINNLEFVIDESNEQETFLRNKIRKIIPQLSNCDKRFDNNFIRTLNHLNNTEQFIAKQTEASLEKIIDTEGQLNTILFAQLDAFLQPKVILHWLINSNVQFELTEKFLAEIIRFLQQTEGKTHKFGTNFSIQKKKMKAIIIK